MEVLMPLMGEGVHEATLVKWLKKVGDQVQNGEPLFEVSTDKVDTEIPSPSSGVLTQILAQENSTVTVGQVLAVLGAAANAAGEHKNPSPVVTKHEPVKAAVPARAYEAPRPATYHGDLSKNQTLRRSSPLVRKIARERNIDLNQVSGTGLGGRIMKADLENVRSGGTALASSIPFGRGFVEIPEGQSESWEGIPARRVKMTKMRRLIAEHMVESVKTSPHVTTVFEVDMHRVVKAREKAKDQFERAEGFKLTITHYLIHAAAQAIRHHPIVNVSVDNDDIIYKEQINVGCAVALDGGLLVPVIKNADTLDVYGIARALNDLIQRAKSKKLKPDDVAGGTFSVTNPGGWGSVFSNPIINQPQVAILGIGAVVKRPVIVEDMIAVRPMMYASLTFDHRVIDGEGGAMYLKTYKEILEKSY